MSKNAPLKLWLSHFAYGGIDPASSASVFTEMHSPEAIAARVEWTNYQLLDHDAAIDRQRAVAAKCFLDSPAEVHLMIDRDIAFQRGDFIHLALEAAKCRGIVGAIVSQKAFGKGFGSRLPDGASGVLGESHLVEMTGDSFMGGAMMAIHRGAYEALLADTQAVATEHYPFFTPVVWHNEERGLLEHLTEDWAFHHRCRGAGVPVYTSFKPVTTHWGRYGYSAYDGMPKKAEKAEEQAA